MYNLDDIVEMYFYCVSPSHILKGEDKILYSKFPPKEFSRLARVYLTRYSDTENRELYCYVEGSVRAEGHPYAGIAGRSGLNVFAALEELAEQLLTMEGNRVLCRYARLLRYRKVTRHLDEDSVVCAYLAVRNKRYGELHTYFSWGPAIGHNNVQLNRILERGISENHFHLFGSAPSCQLIWIYLMNHTADTSLRAFFRNLDESPRSSRNHYYTGYEEECYEIRVLKAALIRVCLTAYLIHPELLNTRGGISLETAERILEGAEQVRDYRMEIQNMINFIKEWEILEGKEELPDYLLYFPGEENSGKRRSCPFAGERWFLYQILHRELTGIPMGEMYRWFYAYLVIKNDLRAELVQTNATVGFENFSIYNKRKGIYKNYGQMAQCAVEGTLETGTVRSLEIRIEPEKTAVGNDRKIRELDMQFRRVADMEGKARIYYVLHFLKKQDQALTAQEYFDGKHCRHYELREALSQKASALLDFRRRYSATAGRVLGIDACSQEIGCRPEVFAPVFRRLSCHVIQDIPTPQVRQLKITYHVGEDFLDVVDGLRAVDEAVRFLNLKCGDRIGHGTVLGINVHKWYEYKDNTILISRQDYLDNVVWLYQKLQEYHIGDCENLKQYLRKQYDLYFPRIYGYLTEPDSSAYIWIRPQLAGRIIGGAYHFGINTYYEAWKLRGDEPALYLDGSYRDMQELSFEDYQVNRCYPENFRVREREEVGLLYYLYHYNRKVREAGSEMEEIYIPPSYVEGAEKVQLAFARQFASYGIGVETNPSSNLAISTMQGYEEHTTPRLYNKNLTYDSGELKNCPQLNVSVNTDDKGVFCTSLENEYGLLACAMERLKDAEGNPLYNRQMIYQWIDDIREMGNLQSFGEEYDDRA